MRDVLALIVCGNRIIEVIAAALGPLPLDQLPKSKPVTPSSVVPSLYPIGQVASEQHERPPWALGGGRKCTHGGSTGRVGPVLSYRASPEMRSGSHHHDWAATPRAAPQS